jgi:hypothetical protein
VLGARLLRSELQLPKDVYSGISIYPLLGHAALAIGVDVLGQQVVGRDVLHYIPIGAAGLLRSRADRGGRPKPSPVFRTPSSRRC